MRKLLHEIGRFRKDRSGNVAVIFTLALLPVSITGVAVAFLLFRLFDVVKPYPAGRMEHLPGGYGIMLDDAMAGVYAHLVLRLCMWWMPSWLIA